MDSRKVCGKDVYNPKRNAHICNCRSDFIFNVEIILFHNNKGYHRI
jgi:hypothetical protein